MFTKKQYSKAPMKKATKRLSYLFRMILKVIKKPSILVKNKWLLLSYFLLAIPISIFAVAILLVIKDVPRATVIGSNSFPQSGKINSRYRDWETDRKSVV